MSTESPHSAGAVTPCEWSLFKAAPDNDNDKRSRRYSAEKVTDVDFADNIALLSNTIDKAQQMLASLEKLQEQ